MSENQSADEQQNERNKADAEIVQMDRKHAIAAARAMRAKKEPMKDADNDRAETTLRAQVGLPLRPLPNDDNLATLNLTERTFDRVVTYGAPDRTWHGNPNDTIRTNQSMTQQEPETENKIGPDLGIELAPAQNIPAAEESHVVTRSTTSSSEFADRRLNYHAGSDAAAFRAVQDVGSRDGRTTKRVDNSRLVERA